MKNYFEKGFATFPVIVLQWMIAFMKLQCFLSIRVICKLFRRRCGDKKNQSLYAWFGCVRFECKL